MALTDADRLQIVAMALMRHSVIATGGGGADLIKYDKVLSPIESTVTSFSGAAYGPGLTPGKSYFASSQYSSTYSAARAFDDDDATYWRSASASTDEYIGVDFGSGNSKTIELLTIKNYSSYGMANFKLQGSNNGTDYTDIYTGTTQNNQGTQPIAISNNTAYRYYRVKNDGTPYGAHIRIHEIEMMEEV